MLEVGGFFLPEAVVSTVVLGHVSEFVTEGGKAI